MIALLEMVLGRIGASAEGEGAKPMLASLQRATPVPMVWKIKSRHSETSKLSKTL